MIRIGRHIVLIALLASWTGLAVGEDVDVKALQEKLRAQEKRLEELQEKLNRGYSSEGYNTFPTKKHLNSPLGDLFFRILPYEYARSIGQSPNWKYNPFSAGMRELLEIEWPPDGHPVIGNRSIVPIPKLSAIPPEIAPSPQAESQTGSDGRTLAHRNDISRSNAANQLASIYWFEQRHEYVTATQLYIAFVYFFPKTSKTGVALQRMAKCLYELEIYYASFLVLEQVIQVYPQSGQMSALVEIELRIAQRLMYPDAPGQLFGKGKNADPSNIKRALGILDTVIAHDPYGPLVAEAYFTMGEGYLSLNEKPAARIIFEIIRDEFPRSDFVERARLGILYCDQRMGQANPQAIREQEVHPFLQEGRPPEQDKTSQDNLDSSLAQLAEVEAGKMMEQAERYEAIGTKNGQEAAKFFYKEIIRRYPGTLQAGRARIVLNYFGVSVPNQAEWPEPPWIAPPLTPEQTDGAPILDRD